MRTQPMWTRPGSLAMEWGGGQQSPVRKKQAKQSKQSTIWSLAALGVMGVACVVAIAVVMSRPPATQASRATDDPDDSPSGDRDLPRAKPVTSGNKLLVPANSAKPAPATNPVGPLGAKDTAAATPAKPPEDGTAPGPSGNTPNQKPSEMILRSTNRTPHRSLTRRPTTEKGKTPEEFDKLLADAKTPEDYRAVADDALRAAGKALDDHHQDTARQLILKSLIAARKSGDAKLIVRATRALIKPESVKELLAEADKEKRQGDSRSPLDSVPKPRSRGRDG